MGERRREALEGRHKFFGTKELAHVRLVEAYEVL